MLEFGVPALGIFIVRRQRAEHAHALHQRGRGFQLALRQAAVVALHLGVVPHAGVQFGVADEQLRHLRVVAAAGVAVQRAGVILLQFVVHAGPAEQGFALFGRVLPLHLPQQKVAELRPKVVAGDAVVPHHRRVAQQPVQQLGRVGVAADHPRHLGVEGLERRKL